MKGFTLLEVLITLAILVTIAAIGTINFFGYYSRQNLGLTVDEIAALVRDAQNRSLTQQDGNNDGNGDQWGVHFVNATTTQGSTFQLFCCGPNFASGILVLSRGLRAGVQFTDPSAGNFKDVVFSKLTGYPNASTSVTMALENNPTQSRIITITTIGQVFKY